MTERVEEIPNKASSVTRCDRIILIILRLLISLSLFISIYIYFCGPVVLKGTDEFRMRHYEPFAFTAIALWIVHLIYGAIRRNVRKESANYFTSMADAFGKKPLRGSFVLVFLSSAIMHRITFFQADSHEVFPYRRQPDDSNDAYGYNRFKTCGCDVDIFRVQIG